MSSSSGSIYKDDEKVGDGDDEAPNTFTDLEGNLLWDQESNSENANEEMLVDERDDYEITMAKTGTEEVHSEEMIEKPTFITRKAGEVLRLLQYLGCREYVYTALRPDHLLTLAQRKLHLLLVGMEAPSGRDCNGNLGLDGG